MCIRDRDVLVTLLLEVERADTVSTPFEEIRDSSQVLRIRGARAGPPVEDDPLAPRVRARVPDTPGHLVNAWPDRTFLAEGKFRLVERDCIVPGSVASAVGERDGRSVALQQAGHHRLGGAGQPDPDVCVGWLRSHRSPWSAYAPEQEARQGGPLHGPPQGAAGRDPRRRGGLRAPPRSRTRAPVPQSGRPSRSCAW